MITDSHCHLHGAEYYLDNREDVYSRAIQAGVRMVVVGTSEDDSRTALEFAGTHESVCASIGVHPHEVVNGWGAISTLAGGSARPVAIGEIGLDYHYENSPRTVQIEALQSQIETAISHELPVIFHVRDAFDDFWPIFDSFHGIRGVLHSFTDSEKNLQEGLKRGLFIGVNGISTFTKDEVQRVMFQAIPLERLLIETDAPYLTPVPLRGRINEPVYVREVAEHLSGIHDIPFGDIAATTNTNADTLFAL